MLSMPRDAVKFIIAEGAQRETIPNTANRSMSAIPHVMKIVFKISFFMTAKNDSSLFSEYFNYFITRKKKLQVNQENKVMFVKRFSVKILFLLRKF